MKRWMAWLGLGLAGALPMSAAGDVVVLLHGLGRGPLSMWRVGKALERDGYEVRNIDYPSTRGDLRSLADAALGPVFANADGRRIDVVTHSMGAIVLRQYLHDHGVPPELGRVVMLGPPNQGSEIVDRLGDWRLFRLINGPAGESLGTAPGDAPRSLGPWPVGAQLGVIAGDWSWNPIFSAIIPGDDDGKVSVARTYLAGESDHLTVRASHTWLMWRGVVIDQVRAFLRDGRFDALSGSNKTMAVGGL